MRLELFGPVGWESADFTHCLNKELISITQACMHLQNHDFFFFFKSEGKEASRPFRKKVGVNIPE